jgi:hypothetical protein
MHLAAKQCRSVLVTCIHISTGDVSEIRALLLPGTSFPIHYSSFIQTLSLLNWSTVGTFCDWWRLYDAQHYLYIPLCRSANSNPIPTAGHCLTQASSHRDKVYSSSFFFTFSRNFGARFARVWNNHQWKRLLRGFGKFYIVLQVDFEEDYCLKTSKPFYKHNRRISKQISQRNNAMSLT